jgi:dephospho-CoA kinase
LYRGKPIIGLAGGIASGKSTVAGAFAQKGCAVIDSDALTTQAYADSSIVEHLRSWWGQEVFSSDGRLDRGRIAKHIFTDPRQKALLESVIHPWVDQHRKKLMSQAAKNAQVVAYLWDTPLLFETGLDQKCDTVVFVDAPEEVRMSRVNHIRGWDRKELERREKLQWPLDKKRKMSDHVISNAADVDSVRAQVQSVLSRVLEKYRS